MDVLNALSKFESLISSYKRDTKVKSLCFVKKKSSSHFIVYICLVLVKVSI